VASIAEPVNEAASISLYVALEEGHYGDLEVISRAAIAWVEAIREAAFITDPFLEVRVEVVSGTEGSFNVNSLIRAVRKTVNNPKRLKAIALGIASYFFWHGVDWVVGKGFDEVWDWMKTEYSELQTLTASEQKEIEEIVRQIANARSPREKTSKVFAELARDQAVTGVGVSLRPGQRPPSVVPRSEFAERAGIISIEEEIVERRMERDRVTLTLLAPALDEEDHKWKFQLGAKTLWAHMEDQGFLERLRPGSNSAPRMTMGIRMEVELETVQEKKDGVWVTIDQTVIKVCRLSEPVSQPAWLDAPTQDGEPK